MENAKLGLVIVLTFAAVAIFGSLILIADNNSESKSENMLTGNAPKIPAPTTLTCTDTDNGLNYFVKGTVTSTGSKPKTDSCVAKSKILKEYYCSELKVQVEYHTCSVSCKNGVCVEPVAPACVDSDGGINYNTSGTTLGTLSGSGEYTRVYDECTSSVDLTEYYCDSTSTYILSVRYSCPNGCNVDTGSCNNALILPAVPSLPPPPPISR